MARFRLPDVLMTTMTRSKLDGFCAFKASAVFRIQINAHPFECGRLVLNYVPVPELLYPNRLSETERATDKMLYLPHTQVDISKETEVTLKVPYVSPYSMYDLTTKTSAWGEFRISVYSQLNTTQSSELTISVWGHFEDIELGSPTSIPVSQVGGEQSGVISGPVSAATGLVKRIGGSVSHILPMVKPVVNSLTSIGSGISTLANLLGFAKPVNVDVPCMIVQRPAPYLSNFDGVDQSLVLSGLTGNKVNLKVPFCGTDADEESLQYIYSMPNYIGAFNYSTTSLPNSILFSTPVWPFYNSAVAVFHDEQGNTVSASTPTLLNFMTSHFRYWRGGLVYTFRFVKTDYHSGRIAISWHPFAGTNQVKDAKNNVLRLEYVYKVIVDLREQTEVSLVVPFTAITKYKICSPEQDTTTFNDVSPFTGTLVVSAINRLQCQSTIVPSTIQCLVECKAADDFETALPCEPFWTSIDTILVNPNTDNEIPHSQTGYASSGTRDLRSNYIDRSFKPKSITGDDRNHAYNSVYAEECIGEKINSISEMIKRPTYRGIINSLSYILYPYDFFPSVLKHTTSDEKTVRFQQNLQTNYAISLINMYAFFRGGVRYKFIPNNSNSNLIELSLFSRSDYTWEPADSAPGSLSQYPTHFENTFVKSIGEVQIPYYSRVDTSVIGSLNGSSAMVDALSPNVGLRIASTEKIKTVYMMSVADDFRLGFFLGCPLAVKTYGLTDYIDFNSVV